MYWPQVVTVLSYFNADTLMTTSAYIKEVMLSLGCLVGWLVSAVVLRRWVNICGIS